jgi:hypothetical protein
MRRALTIWTVAVCVAIAVPVTSIKASGFGLQASGKRNP